MTIFNRMTTADRAYMARRLPRTYRAMASRAEDPAGIADSHTQRLHRRRARLLAFHRHRHKAVKVSKLSRMTGKRRASPIAIKYFEQLCDRICQRLIAHTGYQWPELISRHRGHDLVRARQAGMYLLLKHTHMNLPQVGQKFGGRDHSTVVYARDKVTADLDRFSDIIEPIEQELGVR